MFLGDVVMVSDDPGRSYYLIYYAVQLFDDLPVK